MEKERTVSESRKESGSHEKTYRVTLSWKEKKEMRNPVMNTTVVPTHCRKCKTSHLKRQMKLSTNKKNWDMGPLHPIIAQ